MRGRSYLAMGGTSMGIAGSVIDPVFFENYLGMPEAVDMTEFIRRMDLGIYDKAEYDRALAWVKANCPEGKDFNSEENGGAASNSTALGAAKMALIARDLMVGNSALDKAGHGEERSATTRFVPGSRASGSGPTTIPTATSWKRSSTRLRLEMAAWTPTSWPPRTTP